MKRNGSGSQGWFRVWHKSPIYSGSPPSPLTVQGANLLITRWTKGPHRLGQLFLELSQLLHAQIQNLQDALIGWVPELTGTQTNVSDKTYHSPTTIANNIAKKTTIANHNNWICQKSNREGHHELVHMSRRLGQLGQLTKHEIKERHIKKNLVKY
jgi:hypothetical protein